MKKPDALNTAEQAGADKSATEALQDALRLLEVARQEGAQPTQEDEGSFSGRFSEKDLDALKALQVQIDAAASGKARRDVEVAFERDAENTRSKVSPKGQKERQRALENQEWEESQRKMREAEEAARESGIIALLKAEVVDFFKGLFRKEK